MEKPKFFGVTDTERGLLERWGNRAAVAVLGVFVIKAADAYQGYRHHKHDQEAYEKAYGELVIARDDLAEQERQALLRQSEQPPTPEQQ